MAMVYELLDQQQFFYKELLEQQERNYKSFLQMLVDSTNSRIDNMVKEVQDLKSSLQFTQSDLNAVKRQGAQNAQRTRFLSQGLVSVRGALDALASKAETTKPSKGCVLIDGLPEAKRADTRQKTEPKAKKVVADLADLTDLHLDEIKVMQLKALRHYLLFCGEEMLC